MSVVYICLRWLDTVSYSSEVSLEALFGIISANPVKPGRLGLCMFVTSDIGININIMLITNTYSYD